MLKKKKIFGLNFSSEFLDKLSTFMQEKKYGPGSVLISENVEVDKVYFLISGNIDIFINI